MFNKFLNLDKLLSSSWFLRTVSILIALILWLYVAGDQNAELTRTVSCPVQFRGLEAQTRLDTDTREVEVQLSGERNVITELDDEKVMCEVNLAGLEPGKYRLAIRTTIPKDLKIVNITPSHADVALLRVIEKIFPVIIEVKDGLPSDLFLDRVVIDPQNITIKGEEQAVRSIQKVRIEPTIDQLKSGGKIELPVQVISDVEENWQYVPEPSTVILSAVLAKGLPKRSIPVKVQLSGEPSSDYTLAQVIVEPANVKIEGQLERIRTVTSVFTEVIDITGIDKDQHFVVPLKLPENAGYSFAESNSVSVLVKLKPYTVTKLVTRVPVLVEGTSIYPGWSVDPPMVDVTLEGTPTAMKLIETDDLMKAYVNVTNIVSKKLTVPVLMDLNIPDMQILKIEPSNVSVHAELE